MCEQCVRPSQVNELVASAATAGVVSRGLIHERSSTGVSTGSGSTTRIRLLGHHGHCVRLRTRMRLVAIDTYQPDRADGDQGNEAGEFHGVPTPGYAADSAACARA
jgi:hypothetical protein